MERVSARRWLRPALPACLFVQAGIAMAQAIPALDFARHPQVYEVSLAPDGRHVAMTQPTPDGLETELLVVATDGGQTRKLRFGKLNHVADVVWTDDDRIVLARARNQPLQPRPYSLGQLFSTNMAGDDQEILFGYFRDIRIATARRKDEGSASLVKVLDREPGKALIAFRCWNCGEKPDTAIYKVDSASGERREVERIGEPAGLVFDNSGRARIRVTWDDADEPVLAYRPAPQAEWTPMPKAIAGYDIDFARFAEDDNTVYAAVSDAGEASRMFRIDLAKGTRTALPHLAGVSPSYYELAGRNGIPFAVVYDESEPSVQYLEPQSEFAQLHAGLMRSFPGQLVGFEGFSRDDNIVLFKVWSDRNPGAWYLYDRTTKSAKLIVEARPWLKAAKLAPTRPIAFDSSDGTRIHGLYTAAGDSRRPLIVMPHGGPYNVHDAWGYDSDAQFFASRGYGVLQVNFRGSGGRGANFVKQGYREWGGRMQDDIAAGVRHLIASGAADPERICTFGASYGGYAALMQPIRFPELYRCAIGYVGVYDLATMKSEGDINDTASGRRYLDRVLGTDDAALAASSPARNADKIGVPVFLAQGRIDQRVPMAQFNALRKSLQARGIDVETMVAPGEGHGFYAPQTRAELYERIEAFLDRHLAGAAAAAGSP